MLIVVRHGRTQVNAAGLLLGREDPPLDDLGWQQASALAPVLAGARRVVSSPLRRARETADALGLPVSVDERFIELDYGELEGTPLTAVPGETWARWQADPTWAPPGGESLTDLGRRVRAACEDLVEEATEHDVVVVTHVSPVKACVAWALGTGEEISWHLYVAPASVTRLAVAPPRRSVHAFNVTTHLDAL